jgi:short-subunit dehydrogenase
VQVCQVCPGPVRTEFEAVAGNPTGQAVPPFIELRAEDCARAALAALDRGQALTVPGFWAWLGISAGRISPRWVLRPVFGLLGRLARARLPTATSAPG